MKFLRIATGVKLALAIVVRIVITIAALSTALIIVGQSTEARADDDGGVIMGLGFGTASLSGDLTRRFETRSLAVRMRVGLRFKSYGAELDSSIVNLKGLGGSPYDNWVATSSGPALLYYWYRFPVAGYLRGSLGVGSITGPEYTDVVPCEGAEDCEFKEVTVTPRYPAYTIGASAGLLVKLARRRADSAPVLWADFTVRGMRALTDVGVLDGVVPQLAIGLAYGRMF